MNETKWYKIKPQKLLTFTANEVSTEAENWILNAVFYLESRDSSLYPFRLKPVPPFELHPEYGDDGKRYLLLCNLQDLDEFNYEYLDTQV